MNIFRNVIYLYPGRFKVLNIIKIVRRLKFYNRIFYIPIVDSTSNYLLRHINVLNLGDVCVSEYQLSGRGRLNNFWFSPLVGNIYLSMFWNIYDSSISIVNLSITVSEMIIKVLFDLGIVNISLKWPNDIYLDGKKISGVLIDVIYSSYGFRKIIIGIGINLFPTYNVFCDFHYLDLSNCKIFIDRDILISILINNLFFIMCKLININ